MDCYACDGSVAGVANRVHDVEGDWVPACARHAQSTALAVGVTCPHPNAWRGPVTARIVLGPGSSSRPYRVEAEGLKTATYGTLEAAMFAAENGSRSRPAIEFHSIRARSYDWD